LAGFNTTQHDSLIIW